MNTPSAAVLNLLAVAAEMRATGSTWETVAVRVGRHPDTCRHWPSDYPNEWNRLYGQAEDHLFSDLGTEARLTLRGLLRSENERVRADIGKFLINLRMRVRERQEVRADPAADPPGDAARIDAFLGSFNHAQVQEIHDDFAAPRPPAADVANAATDALASPAGPG